MKPVKAPRQIDKYLRSRFGFGFGDGYYQGTMENLPLSVTLHFGKHDPGALIHLGLHYPVGAGGVQMNPLETSVLNPDGTLLSVPDLDETELFWALKQQTLIVESLEISLPKWMRVLSDTKIMVGLYNFLLGNTDTIPTEFDQIESPYLKRKETANRLLGKACYLSLAGRYEDAKNIIKLISPGLVGEAEEKVLSDCQSNRIRVPRESIEYLSSIGVKMDS